MGALTIWTMDKLQTVNGACSPATMNSLTTWQRPALRTINGSVNFVSMTNLTSVVATNIVSINGYVYLRGVVDTLGGLTNINIGTVGVTTNLAGSWLFSSNKLTIASCSNNLAVLDSLNGTSNKQYWGTSMIYNVVGNTNAPLSAWSPIMYTWKTNIQNRGGTVLATP